jgi:hypothetical protein
MDHLATRQKSENTIKSPESDSKKMWVMISSRGGLDDWRKSAENHLSPALRDGLEARFFLENLHLIGGFSMLSCADEPNRTD